MFEVREPSPKRVEKGKKHKEKKADKKADKANKDEKKRNKEKAQPKRTPNLCFLSFNEGRRTSWICLFGSKRFGTGQSLETSRGQRRESCTFQEAQLRNVDQRLKGKPKSQTKCMSSENVYKLIRYNVEVYVERCIHLDMDFVCIPV